MKGVKEMKSTRIMVFVTILVFLLTCPLAATAGMHRGILGPSGKDPGLIGMKVFLELKLTPAQQEEMLNIVSRFERDGEALYDQARRARWKLASVMRAEKFDENALRQAYREVSSAREEVLVLKGRMMQELKGQLRPEQKETLDRMKTERRGKWKARMRAWGQTNSE
jgi:Spy/CpxP family protein refolding chaperone